MKVIKNSMCAIALASAVSALGADQPTGSLDVSSQLVRASSSVMLTWDVQFPAAPLEEIIEIDEEDETIVTSSQLDVEVRMIGSGYGDNFGEGDFYSFAKFSDELLPNSFFSGAHSTINPTTVIKSRQNVSPGIRLNMSAKGIYASRYADGSAIPMHLRSWNPFRNMGQGNGGIIILKNGDDAPEFSPERDNQDAVKTFLLPYLNDSAEKVKIGKNDVIILFDLNKYTPEEGADFQDVVMLMTFKES